METGSGTGGGTATDVAERPEDVKEQAQQAAGVAAEQGKHVTAVAGEEAQKVAQEGVELAKGLLDDARNQLLDQSRSQRDSLVQTLGSLGSDLERMSAQGDGLAADLVRQAAQRVRDISSRLDGREPTELLDEVRDFARRRTGTFLLGAVAAGVVAGRLARGAQKAHQDGGSDSPSTGVPTQRFAAATGSTASTTPTRPAAHASTPPPTPQADAMASFPADRPAGPIS